MAKTKEELEQLKKEYRALVSKAKELSDDELREISGGLYYTDEYHKNKSDVSFLFNVGDYVEVYSGWMFGTVHCRIEDRRIVWYETSNTGAPGVYVGDVKGYRDEYLVKETEDHWFFYLNNEWVRRKDIQIRKFG